MFDLSKFNKIKEDKDSTTLKHKTEDHEIRIVHAYIPKIRREQLKRLKLAEGGEAELKHKEREEARDAPLKPAGTLENYHEKGKNTPIGQMNRENDLKKFKRSKGPNIQGLADGGEVDDNKDNSDQDQQQSPAATHITINAAPASQGPPPTPVNTAAQDYQANAVKVQQPQVQANQPNVDANGQPLPGVQEKNVQTTANNQANIDTSAAQAQAANETAYQKAIAQQQQVVNDRLQYMANHVDDFKNFINQNPVEADRRSIGSKVGNAFAIALSGVNGKGNPALDFLNNQLNRDFQAQKENVNNQNNILSAYERLYGRGVEADASTKATLLDLYDHKNKQTAAMLGTPQAQVNAQKISNDLTTQKQKALQDAASQISALPGGHGGSAQPQSGNTGAMNGRPSSPGATGDWSDNAQAMTQPGGMQKPGEDSILAPGAEQAFIAAKYNPKTRDQYGKLSDQYNQAVQSQKALDAVNEKFPQLQKEATYSDYLANKINPNIVGGIGGLAGAGAMALGAGLASPITGGASLVGALPAIGLATGAGTGAGEAIGHGARQGLHALAGQQGLQYDADKAALTKIIAASLRGTNVSSEQIQDVIDSNVPKIVDDKETYNKKIKNIKDFIKQNTDTSLTKMAKITR
jgi:hypothetical protein